MLKKAIGFITSPQKRNKIFSKIKYYRFLYHHKKRDLVLPYPPLNIRIEPTNFCNLKCVMCPQSIPIQRQKGYMDIELYKKIIKEIRNFSFPTNVILYLGGESLLHREFIQMVEIAKKAGLFVELNTNATLLDENFAVKLLNNNIDTLTFSFDDVDKEVYENMRVNASYDRTLQNIVNFLKLKKTLRKKTPFIIIASLKLLNENEYIDNRLLPQVSENFKEYFKHLPVDLIKCNWAHGWAGDFKQKGYYHYKTNRIDFNGDCYLVWRDITISWDGKVLACCYDLHGDIILGDLNKESITHVWNGEAMVNLRKKLVKKDINDLVLCKNCVMLKGEISFF